MLSAWFQNIPVRQKIAWVVAFFSLVLVAMLGLSIRDVRAGQDRNEAMYRQNLLATGDLTAVRTSLLRALVLANNVLRAGSPDQAARFEADMDRMDANFDAAWERYQGAWTSEVTRQAGPQYHALALEQRQIRKEVMEMARKGDLPGARKLLAEKIDISDTRLGPIGAQLVKDNANQASEALENGRRDYRNGLVRGITFSILGILVGSLLGLALKKGIHDPLIAFGGVLAAVAKGDLTAHCGLARADEFGQLSRHLDMMVAGLRTVLGEVRQSIEGVSSGAAQLAASAEEMAATSTGIDQMSTRLRSGSERMASAVTELSASIDEVNQGAQASLDRLARTQDLTGQGQEAGASTRQAMAQIADTAGQISRAVGVIQEIANQTNLLSLNAAIEAAKAGEHGKGFSVVAEEVRKLAERSGSSAKEVDQLITAAREAVAQGERTVGTAVATLAAIRTSLDEFADQTRRVATATVEQARAGADVARQVEAGSQEAGTVATAVGQMSTANQEVARTANDLTRLAEGLHRQVAHFTL